MTEKELKISYKELAFDELSAEDRQLVDAAIASMQNAIPHIHISRWELPYGFRTEA